MNTPTETRENYDTYLLHNYASPAIALKRGRGSRVTDDQGKQYLDFTSGIAVNALGHCHPHFTQAIRGQLEEMVHCSNLFAIPGQGKLAKRLAHYTPPGRFLFCNSGAEANEALLKLARLHGQEISGEEGKRYTVLSAENAFHGRTFGGMAATPQEKIQKGFRPMLPGFRHAKLNDVSSFEKAMAGDDVAAVILETIQGEGGIFPTEASFLQELRTLCTEKNVLLIMDEVQCGIGRCGSFFAYEDSGITPDAIGMAKGLGSGYPIGAIWVHETKEHLFTPGSHGTTFGGSPLASAAAGAVLDVLEKEDLIEKVKSLSRYWLKDLEKVKLESKGVIKEIRGRGFLLGMQIEGDHLGYNRQLRQAGLLLAPAGGQTLRLIPPLTASKEELDEGTSLLRQVFVEQA